MNKEFSNTIGRNAKWHKLSGERDFPGGPVVKTRASTAGGTGLIPGWGTKILLCGVWPKKTKTKTNKNNTTRTTKFSGEKFS